MTTVIDYGKVEVRLTKGREVPDYQVLEDWITLPDAAEQLGVSRQALHQRLGTIPEEHIRQTRSGRKLILLSADWLNAEKERANVANNG